MRDLIERLKVNVRYAETTGENMDDVSWGMQSGILISNNEAKQLTRLSDMLETILNIEDGAFGLKGFAVHRLKAEIKDVLGDTT